MPLPEFVMDGIVSLDRELVRYPHEYPDVSVAVVPVKLLRDMRSLIVWAGDEVAQLMADRNEAIKHALTLAIRCAEAESELAEVEAGDVDELWDQQIAYFKENV